jgi:uncharacterized membrane protein
MAYYFAGAGAVVTFGMLLRPAIAVALRMMGYEV